MFAHAVNARRMLPLSIACRFFRIYSPPAIRCSFHAVLYASRRDITQRDI